MPAMMTFDEVMQARSLCEVFQRTVSVMPDSMALREYGSDRSITWREYGAEVRRIAAGLADLGVQPGDTVAIMLTNRPEFHFVDAAVMHLGATSFSIYNTFTGEQISSLLASSGARVMVCESRFADVIGKATSKTPVSHLICVNEPGDGMISLGSLTEHADSDFDFERAWRAVGPEDLVALIYTSGTTGDPKGVELTHANLLFASASKAAQQHEFTRVLAEERVISYLPDANLANRFAAHYVPMLLGSTTTEVAEGRQVLEAFASVHPCTFMGVPMIWYKLKSLIESIIESSDPRTRADAERALTIGRERARLTLAGALIPPDLEDAYEHADRAVLGKLRYQVGIDELVYATSGGAPIAPEVLEFFLAIGVSVCEVYGMTETAATGFGNHASRIRIGTVGRPRPGVEARLDVDGELLIRSRGIMRGYRNDPAKTAEAITEDGWLRTGDIATIDADGFVTIVDRKKDIIINSSGKNLAPANIENALKQSSALLGTVVAIGDGRPFITALITLDREQSVAFARSHDISDLDAGSLSAHPLVLEAVAAGITKANDRLARVEQIRQYTVLPDYWEPNSEELTATTKLRRKLVNEKYAHVIDAMYQR